MCFYVNEIIKTSTRLLLAMLVNFSDKSIFSTSRQFWLLLLSWFWTSQLWSPSWGRKTTTTSSTSNSSQLISQMVKFKMLKVVEKNIIKTIILQSHIILCSHWCKQTLYCLLKHDIVAMYVILLLVC
jgi:hypothetical protein